MALMTAMPRGFCGCSLVARALMLVLCLAVCTRYSHALEVGCLDENGAVVSYWIAFKQNSGYNYLYADVNDLTLKASPHAMNETDDGALALTSQQLWRGLEYLAYNDEPAVSSDDDGAVAAEQSGHSKGFLAFNTTLGYGFWLTHSVPIFPLTPKQTPSYEGLGDNAIVYAQSFHCMTLTLADIETLSQQLLLNAPDIYSFDISTDSQTQFPALKDLVTGSFPTTSTCSSASVGHATVFSKTGEWGKDLWDDCVTPAYKTDFLVESWIRGSAVGPACPPDYSYQTLDVQYVAFDAAFQWKETQDHSKWGIGDTQPIVCFGDINRMTTQFSRGGGATCFEDATIWQQIRTAITQHNSCTAEDVREFKQDE